MSLEQLNDYIDRLKLTKVDISKQYLNENGKPVSRQFISQILLGKDAMSPDGFMKLVNAINRAQVKKKSDLLKLANKLDSKNITNKK